MTLLQAWGNRARAAQGWRRAGLAFLCGAVSALGFAPLEFFPALLLGYAALVTLLDGAALSPRRLAAGFATGWAFGFGQYLVGMHWIVFPFMVQPDVYLWMLPFALFFLTAGLALFTGVAGLMTVGLRREGPSRIVLFALAYGVLEWLRGHILTGFPWNLPAYGWGASLAILQSTAILGAYGLSFLTVLLGASFAQLATPGGLRRVMTPFVMVVLFAGLWAFGALRLASHPTEFVPGVQLRVVQPAIPQPEKYKAAFVVRNWNRLVALSEKPGHPTHIIWPEAAPPFPLQREPVALEQIAQITGSDHVLLTGAERFTSGVNGLKLYNSLFIFGPRGQLRSVYDKFHLVPFGEYVPYAKILNRFGITKLTEGQIGFSTGDGPHVYPVPGAPPVSPLICYEVIFPGQVTDHHHRPGWFVNVTDDSWFGPWAGPRQHFLIARVRAIEEALPIVRAANTGISAIIDPNGRVISALKLGEMGVLDARLPKALEQSTYARYGDLAFILLLVGAALTAWILGRI